MKTRFLIAAVGGSLLFSTGSMAQVQVRQQGNMLEQLLGAVFGTTPQVSEQTMESDWNQGRRSFAQRRAALDARIDSAVRDGSLSRGEAERIRDEYDEIVRLEANYSANGNMSQQQRSDLRMRYRALTQRIGGQGSDQPYGQGGYQDVGRWDLLSTRSADFDQRVNAALRNRELSRTEAARLRNDWLVLAQVERSYQRGGFDAREQADLWARYNAIDNRLGGGLGNDRNRPQWNQLETRLVAAEQSGRISRNEAVHVRSQLSDLARLDVAYSSGGLNADERAYLLRRYGELEQTLGYFRR